jgi:hypothetical protein
MQVLYPSPSIETGEVSACVASYRPVSFIISLLLARSSHASERLFGHGISEQNLTLCTRFRLLNSYNNVLFHQVELV